MSVLTGPRAEAASGVKDSLVIFLHGYGADGNDLFGLAQALAPHLPNTAFRSPNAPERCAVNPMGYQWFPISWLDGSPESEMAAGAVRAAKTLHRTGREPLRQLGPLPSLKGELNALNLPELTRGKGQNQPPLLPALFPPREVYIFSKSAI